MRQINIEIGSGNGKNNETERATDRIRNTQMIPRQKGSKRKKIKKIQQKRDVKKKGRNKERKRKTKG